MKITAELVIQIVILLLGCSWIGNLIHGIFQRKKVKAAADLDEANATQVIVGTATGLLGPLTKKIKQLEEESTGLREELKSTRSEVHRLNRLLYEANNRLEATTAENKRITAENRQLRLRLQNGSSS